MKLSLFFGSLFLFLCFERCGNKMIKNNDGQTDTAVSGKPLVIQNRLLFKGTNNLIIKDEHDLLGYWVGRFEPDTTIANIYAGERKAWDYSNKINISIDEIKGDSVKGHSVVAGNYRPFAGVLRRDTTKFHFAVSEPGDDKYDGKFKFDIAKNDSILTGSWKSNNKIRITARKYTLTKKNFRYDPSFPLQTGQYVDWTKSKTKKFKDDELGNGYDISYFTTSEDVYKFNASKDLLTKEQVSNMKKADLFILRNSIYARHGYSFKNQQLRAYFDLQQWYIPISTDIKSDFTDIEKKNIELLLRYEKNAKEYYDAFGRG